MAHTSTSTKATKATSKAKAAIATKATPTPAPVQGPSVSAVAQVLANQHPPLSLNVQGQYIPGVATSHLPKRATIAQFATVTVIGTHPGKGYRVRRWANLLAAVAACKANGQALTLYQCMATPGLDHLDVGYWQKCGLVRVTPPTAATLAAATAAAAAAPAAAPAAS